jgi:two-component system, NarL family, sensor histidine kinase DegS
MTLDRLTAEAKGTNESTLDILRAEVERVNAELRDIRAKLDQSRGQVEQLAQRNAQVLGEVRRIEGTLEQTPRVNIKDVYTEALDSQQRLLTLRAQTEKLSGQETIARQELDVLKQAIDALTRAPEPAAAGSKKGGATMSDREMIIKVIDAQEEERKRLVDAMHDGPAHSLSNFILQAEIVQKLFEKNPEKAREELALLKAAAGDAFQRVREFIFNLRPMMLTDLGLVPTIKRHLSAFQDQTNIETEFVMTGRERRLEGYREVLVFRGLQELLGNARDRGATSVKVTIEMGDDQVYSIVEDNGRAHGTGKLSLEAVGQIGLSALQERIMLVDGNLTMGSVGGHGSRVEFSIPTGSEPSDRDAGEDF